MNFEQNIFNIYDSSGKIRLSNFPKIIDQASISLGLSDLHPIQNLSHHYILSGFQGKQRVILKLGIDSAGLKQEAEALKAFSDFGAIQVLGEQDSALLLECASPGTSLKSYFPEKEDESIQIACSIIKKLHQAPLPQGKFPDIHDWLTALDQSLDIPNHYLQKARELRDKLLQNSSNPVLLHGDLHHDNILQSGIDWVVIDPKGVIGDPTYEVASFIRNPMPELLDLENAIDIINNRISVFSKELNLNHERIINWCFVQSVLSWAWSLEDNINSSYFRKITKILESIQ